MAKESADLTEFAKKAAACDSVRFTFTDINGLPRTKLVPGPQTSHFIQNGVGSWAGVTSLGTRGVVFPKEVSAINDGNATAMPDPKTFYEVTWSSKDDLKIGEVRNYLNLSNLTLYICLVVLLASSPEEAKAAESPQSAP